MAQLINASFYYFVSWQQHNTWNQVFLGYSEQVNGLMALGGLAGFILLITVFKKSAAPITTPLYALSQGLFLGGFSAILEQSYPGIVIQAVALTFGTLFCLLSAYKSKLIKATENFKLGIYAATGGIGFVYLASFILGFFGIQIPGIFGNGGIGILFSLF